MVLIAVVLLVVDVVVVVNTTSHINDRTEHRDYHIARGASDSLALLTTRTVIARAYARTTRAPLTHSPAPSLSSSFSFLFCLSFLSLFSSSPATRRFSFQLFALLRYVALDRRTGEKG